MAENEILNRAFEKGILKKTHVILLKYLVQKLDVSCETLYSDLSLQEWDLVTVLFELKETQIIEISQDFRIKLQDNWFSLIDEKINKNQQINIAYIDVLRACVRMWTHHGKTIYKDNNIYNINNINNINNKEKENNIKEKENFTNNNLQNECLENKEAFALSNEFLDPKNYTPSNEIINNKINEYLDEQGLTDFDFIDNFRERVIDYLNTAKNRTKKGWEFDLRRVLSWKNIQLEFTAPTRQETLTIIQDYISRPKTIEKYSFVTTIDPNFACDTIYDFYCARNWKQGGKNNIRSWSAVCQKAIREWDKLRNSKSKIIKANYDAQMCGGFNSFVVDEVAEQVTPQDDSLEYLTDKEQDPWLK